MRRPPRAGLEEFETVWLRDPSQGKLESAKIVCCEPEEGPRGELDIDRIELEILRELERHPNGQGMGAPKSAILEVIGGPPSQVEAVWSTLVTRRVLVNVNGKARAHARYALAAGVVVPAHAHEPVKLNGKPLDRLEPGDVETCRPPSKRPEYRQNARRGGRAA